MFWSEETNGWEWVWGRQERLHLVHPKADAKDADSVRSFVVQDGRWFARWR